MAGGGSGSGSADVGAGAGARDESHPRTGFQVKRVYDDPAPQDGFRVLVDRLWPRGISKERAELDEWAKDVAPSNELRQWLHAERDDRYDDFAARYAAELATLDPEQQRHLDALRAQAAKQIVTLLTAAKDPEHSHVPVLLRCLEQ